MYFNRSGYLELILVHFRILKKIRSLLGSQKQRKQKRVNVNKTEVISRIIKSHASIHGQTVQVKII